MSLTVEGRAAVADDCIDEISHDLMKRSLFYCLIGAYLLQSLLGHGGLHGLLGVQHAACHTCQPRSAETLVAARCDHGKCRSVANASATNKSANNSPASSLPVDAGLHTTGLHDNSQHDAGKSKAEATPPADPLQPVNEADCFLCQDLSLPQQMAEMICLPRAEVALLHPAWLKPDAPGIEPFRMWDSRGPHR